MTYKRTVGITLDDSVFLCRREEVEKRRNRGGGRTGLTLFLFVFVFLFVFLLLFRIHLLGNFFH
jgi:hypothetical protein